MIRALLSGVCLTAAVLLFAIIRSDDGFKKPKR